MDHTELIEIDSEVLARTCVEVCEEGRAEEIRLFDVREHSILADFFLICTGTSLPHLNALAERIRVRLNADGLMAKSRDGEAGNQWIVLDYGLIIIHIIDPELREFYKIEDLWEAGNLVQESLVPDSAGTDEG